MIILYFFSMILYSFLSKFLIELIIIVLLITFSLKLFNSIIFVELDSYEFSSDSLRILLIILRIFIISLLISGRYTNVNFLNKSLFLFLFTNFFILMFLVLSFIRAKLINFYIFFEASLIPIFLLIMGWGYQPERLQAGIYMLFYTLFASLPLILVILFLKEEIEYFYERFRIISINYFNRLVLLILILAFLVKLPIFFFHLWLPKAHVEAPVAGSIILAGVLLKLGGYGLWRVLFNVKRLILEISWLFLIIGLIGGLIVRFVCFIQIDIKCLVAYSSVVHIGILLRGIMRLSFIGYQGALALMLGHGLVSSGIFYLVGTLYDRLSTRRLLINKGLIIIFPSVTIIWFILRVFNIRAPPSVSLLGEILLTSGVLFYRKSLFLALILINFMGMVFTFYLYAQSQQGKPFSFLHRIIVYRAREYLVGWLHLLIIFSLTFIFWIFLL